MSRYDSRQEIADKADYEGGLLEFIFGYGLEVDDLPEDDTVLRSALEAVLEMRPRIEALERLLPEPYQDDE